MSLEVDIRKHFPAFDLDVQLQAEDEVFGLLGASGCGKSLTMRSIAGIETPDEGRIVVNGKVFFDSEQGINLKPQQRKTALLFQNYMLFPNLTVEDNVAAGIPKEVSKAERDAIVLAELRRFDVEAFAKRYPAQLSGGQQQRVALARMLAARPGILMLDEPFSALDAHLKGVLEQNLSSLFDAFDGTILYVSHDIDEAVRFCDRVAVIERGHVMEIDTVRELVDNPQSVAGLKLSGCKNVAEVTKLDDGHVRCEQWGVDLSIAAGVPDDVKAVGIRAFYIERADGPGENVYRMRVDRTSDSRFDRMCLLSFLDRFDGAPELVGAADQEMHFLHQRVYWRINMLYDKRELPEVGDELYVRLPVDKIYIVNK
ncbi:MAG: ATP-binding cassette domain-containing protein [Eggerthellaceae bacterium]|nr:ATP-binding cassette domain-containing protein [Eggerthellaceae bacterium]